MNNIVWPNKMVDDFVQRFSPAQEEVKKYKPCRIKVNGVYIKMWNGKTLWKCKAHAKSALNNAWKYQFDRDLHGYFPHLIHSTGINYQYIPSHITKKHYQEFIDFLQKQGILEFVEIYE